MKLPKLRRVVIWQEPFSNYTDAYTCMATEDAIINHMKKLHPDWKERNFTEVDLLWDFVAVNWGYRTWRIIWE